MRSSPRANRGFAEILLYLIAAGVVIAALDGLYLKIHSDGDSQGYQRARGEDNAKLIEAQKAAAAEQARLTKQLQDAQNAAIERDQTIRTLSANAARASSGLRDTLDALRAGVPTATIQALRDATVALTTVFGDCQEKYRGLAEVSDRHASDVKTLSDAWPAPVAPKR